VILSVVLTFVFVVALIVGLYVLLVIRPDASAQRALKKRMRPEDPIKTSRLTVPASELRDRGATPFKAFHRVIDQSGLRLTVPTLIFMCWMAGFVVGLITWMVTARATVTAGAGAVAMTLPYFWVRRVASKRLWKFEEQFPEAIELVARALRAGHAFPTGLSMVADEVGAPVGPEFKLLYDRQNYGMALPDALRAFAERIPILDARFFVTAVLTQRESGGNLSGILDNLASVIRERFKVKRQVKVISAHGRMTAGILCALPPFVGLSQMVIAPDKFTLLFTDPLGNYMLLGALVMQGVGMLVIRQIVNIKY
jgi:tight adherence protein B